MVFLLLSAKNISQIFAFEPDVQKKSTCFFQYSLQLVIYT